MTEEEELAARIIAMPDKEFDAFTACLQNGEPLPQYNVVDYVLMLDHSGPDMGEGFAYFCWLRQHPWYNAQLYADEYRLQWECMP